MLEVEYTTQFKRDLKLAKRRHNNLSALQKIMQQIQAQEVLSHKLKDHLLSGNWSNHRELHIGPDWLLIYKLVPKRNVVIFVRVGTHADLFD